MAALTLIPYRGILGTFVGLVTGREKKNEKIIARQLRSYNFNKDFNKIGKVERKLGKARTQLHMLSLMGATPKSVLFLNFNNFTIE